MNHICIVSSMYPTDVTPTALTFVQQLAWAISDRGIKVSVICPVAVNVSRKYKNFPETSFEMTPAGNMVQLYFPHYFSSGYKKIFCFNTTFLTIANFEKAVDKVLNEIPDKPEVLYGHFITPAGIVVCHMKNKYSIPAFIGYGESAPWSINNYGLERTRKTLKSVDGVISVSTANKHELIDLDVVESEKIAVFPNGYLSARFRTCDKNIAREHFGLPKDAFIVSFVGHFIKRKGITVLDSAMKKIPDTYMICAGKGELAPKGEHVLYSGLVKPEEVYMFYSASDVFVLPTLNEGCCNAIIEAMACGLPIISSDLSFNDDILDESNSLRIDPKDVDAVADAIKSLRDNTELRNRLAAGSLEKAKGLTLEKRAENIIKFMDEMVSRSK